MERTLQHILDAALDGMIVLDARGSIEHVNPEACRILETASPSLSARPVEELLGPSHAVAKLAREVLSTRRGAVAREQTIDRKHEGTVLVDVAVAPLLNSEGKASGAIVTLRDRTIQAQLQELVGERDRLAAFGQIATGLAHEVKNPLGGIRGTAELLAARAQDGKTKQAADLIVREVDRIADLVEDFMILARRDELRLGSVNVHRVLDHVLSLLARDPLADGIAVERLFDPSIPEFQADADRLTQVFLNLARNAMQAIPDRPGKLSITTGMSLEFRLSSPDGKRLPTLFVEFRDTGSGIDPDILDKLGTPFFTTRSGGTGLGLAVANHWVSRHGGTTRIDSQIGEGTRVRVFLPLQAGTP